MFVAVVRSSVGGALAACLVLPARADEALSADRYVEIVLRAHPAAALGAGLERAAAAERKAARLFPDPVVGHSRGRATPTGPPSDGAAEREYSIAQTIPWPGAFRAGIRAADRAADVLRAEAEASRWDLAAQARRAFARLAAARALLEVARAAEADARSVRDLVSRRAELGEARESDRIKAAVEWLRQQRGLAAAEREAEAAEAIARTLAVEPLPAPLAVEPTAHPALPRLDPEALAGEIADRSPGLRGARAEVERRAALLSAARRGRFPDLAVALTRQRELDKDASGVSLALEVPLWNANRGEIARADAARRVAAASAERLRLELLADLRERLKDLQVAGDQASLLSGEILPAAERGVHLVRRTFEEGETSLLDLLDAQRTLRDAQREAAAARLALSVALAEVQRLAGPGFDPWR